MGICAPLTLHYSYTRHNVRPLALSFCDGNGFVAEEKDTRVSGMHSARYELHNVRGSTTGEKGIANSPTMCTRLSRVRVLARDQG